MFVCAVWVLTMVPRITKLDRAHRIQVGEVELGDRIPGRIGSFFTPGSLCSITNAGFPLSRVDARWITVLACFWRGERFMHSLPVLPPPDLP